jgi:tellurite resistance protein TerC
MDVQWWIWVAFATFVLAMILLDLVVFGRRPHEVTTREAAAWSTVWLTLGLGFGGVVWAWQGSTRAAEYTAGYLIEKSLSVDNIFVFALIFSYFAVPLAYRQRVLLWGVIGALVLRAILIFVGAALLDTFHVVIYLFGALLVATGIKMALAKGHEIHPERNPALRLLRRAVPIAADYDGQRLVTRQHGRRVATPLAAVFVVVATTDLVFAIDSIPAIFAVTDEPFIVLTANVFALLGLRALYFLLQGMMQRFRYLQPALAAILVFVGTKMLIVDLYKIPVWASLGVIAVILAAGVALSLRASGGHDDDPRDPGAGSPADEESPVTVS